MTVTIYHNSSCGTSRNVLGLIPNSSVEPQIVEYLKTSPNRQALAVLRKLMSMTPRQLLREKGTPYHESKLDDLKWTDDQLIDFMLRYPVLINRPIIVALLGAKLCRPSEVVLDILVKPLRGAFTKENGQPQWLIPSASG